MTEVKHSMTKKRIVSQAKLKIKDIIKKALAEDVGRGDITTKLIVSKDSFSEAQIVAKQAGILAGSKIVQEVFKMLSPKIKIRFNLKEGEKFQSGDIIAELEGPTRAILTGERTALNFLCRLSGIATLTRRFVEKIAGTNAIILDTRKTTPNLRILEKYAVRIGGGQNHRFGLFDMILIKDNHIVAAGSLINATKTAQLKNKARLPIEVECKNISEVKQALSLNVPWIMLDNMNLKQIKQAVRLCQGKSKLEVSGGVNLKNVQKIAETGVNYISVGAITHSAPHIDISLEIKKCKTQKYSSSLR
ncbi:MAG: carboxylating nicotinate-nucleotide diphosphorylase [candidate division WOR-3 bacterium]